MRTMRWVGSLALCMVAAWAACRAAEKPVAQPKGTAEAEEWLRKELQVSGCKDAEFDMDRGVIACALKSGPGHIDLYRITRIGAVVGDSGGLSVSYWVKDDPKEYKVVASGFGRERLERYRAALVYLQRQASHAVIQSYEAKLAKALEEFKPKAETWRAMAVKPKMPDDAYAHMVLAENAYKNKDLKRALQEYELGLYAFPTWPDGQSNAAVIAAELGDYRLAVHCLQEYLLLVPDAPDAQTAKNNMIIWQDKITHPQ